MTDLVGTRAELGARLAGVPGTVGVVMTMGALHDGHLALLRAARQRAGLLVATVFVNPLQFGPHEDFDKYPRTLAADAELCAAAGVDVVFAPSAAEMYPFGAPSVRVDPGPPGELLEGASRPGFFRGVLTVVAKLLAVTRADLAFFGEKDYQQLTLIKLMVQDLDLGVEIHGVPTVREADGLALSSRNRYLSAAERGSALALSAALRAGLDAAAGGAGAEGALAAAHRVLAAAAGVELDYLALTDPHLGPPPVTGPARLLVAARVGATRLIDNVALSV